MDGAVAVVTGAAGGIGREIAARLGAAGAVVAGCDRAAVSESLAGAAGVAEAHALDVTDPAAVRSVIARVGASRGRIDVLVNAAGVLGETADPLATTAAEWDQVFAVNARGTFLTIQAAEPFLRARGGSVVNLSSVAAKEARHTYLAYGASKAAVLQITWSMAALLAPHGIRVNAVCPGPVDTPMWTAVAEREGPEHASRIREQRRQEIPLGRFATPADVAHAVCLLVDPASDYLTGVALDVAGGARLGVGT
jgi:NAD(P)-dependent dehydrogenase (short-subunit alcohol dehydrogenase family)